MEERVFPGFGLPSTVLAVDDSLVVQEMIKRALEGDHRVLVVDNAADALVVISHEYVSLMLLDVTMPRINGLELCRTIRSLPKFHDLPVVMLSACDGAFDRVQGRLAGATEYLTKPFDAEQLRQVVNRLIRSE